MRRVLALAAALAPAIIAGRGAAQPSPTSLPTACKPFGGSERPSREPRGCSVSLSRAAGIAASLALSLRTAASRRESPELTTFAATTTPKPTTGSVSEKDCGHLNLRWHLGGECYQYTTTHVYPAAVWIGTTCNGQGGGGCRLWYECTGLGCERLCRINGNCKWTGTVSPTPAPVAPTTMPTAAPVTKSPTLMPTARPVSPTAPTRKRRPTRGRRPTKKPTFHPTTKSPTTHPTHHPTTGAPTFTPTVVDTRCVYNGPTG